MWPYTLATLRFALRSPLVWVLLAVGAFTGWFGATAAILALDEVGAQGQSLLLGTGQLVGILLTLWLVGRSLEEDQQSGFAAAADAARTGPLAWRHAGGIRTCQRHSTRHIKLSRPPEPRWHIIAIYK